MIGTGLRRRTAASPHDPRDSKDPRRPGDADEAASTGRLALIGLAGAVALLVAAPGVMTAALSHDTGTSAAASAPVAAAAADTARHAGDPARSAQAAPAAQEPAASTVAPPRVPATHPAASSAVPHAEVRTEAAGDRQTGTPLASGQAGTTAATQAVEAMAMPEPAVTTVRYGPIPVLPAILGNPSSTTAGVPLLANLPLLPAPCTNCFATGTTIDMVYENGQPANLDTGVMLHHLVLFQPQVDDATCARTTPVGLLGQRFFASGNERTAGNLPDGYGIHLGTGPLAAFFDIMNHSNELKLVYLTASVRWLPDSTPGIKAVTPVWFDQNNCSTSTYAIPAGPSTRTWQWTSTLTGRFVTAGGHVHDGGVRTMLMNETTGEHVCSSVAGYGTKPAYMGSIESMSLCSWDRLGTVRKGEVLSLETDYVSSQAQSDVMGIMLAYLYPTDDLAGGAPAPTSMTDPPVATPPPLSHHHG